MKRISFSRTLLCIVLSLLFLSNSFSIMAASSQKMIDDTKVVHRKVYVYDGQICYYEKSFERTINSMVIDGFIEFNMAYTDDLNHIYQAKLPVHSYVQLEEQLLNIEHWEKICEDGLRIAECSDVAVSGQIETISLATTTTRSSDAGVLSYFHSELESLYGPSGTERRIGTRLYDSVAHLFVTVNEHYTAYVGYEGQVQNLWGVAFQVAATILGLNYDMAGLLLGIGVGQLVPTDTEVAMYSCTALYERIGTLGGTPYYVTSYIRAHRAYHNTSNDELVFDSDILNQYYVPSSTVYNSFDKICEYTIAIYEG